MTCNFFLIFAINPWQFSEPNLARSKLFEHIFTILFTLFQTPENWLCKIHFQKRFASKNRTRKHKTEVRRMRHLTWPTSIDRPFKLPSSLKSRTRKADVPWCPLGTKKTAWNSNLSTLLRYWQKLLVFIGSTATSAGFVHRSGLFFCLSRLSVCLTFQY